MIPGYGSPNLASCSAAVAAWLTDPQHPPISQTTATWDAADWEAARWAVQVHGIGPLLDHASTSWPDRDALDHHFRGYLASQRQRSHERVTLLLGELAEILHACARHGIDVMPLKGSLLATEYYPAPGLRPMSDLDLLVRPADQRATLDVLQTLGFAQISRGWKHIMLARPEAFGAVVDYTGEHPDNPRSLDLHIRIAEQFWGMHYDLTDDVWAESEPARVQGAPARRLRPAGLLHHLAVHASSDMIARRLRLLHLHDLALVAAQVDHAGWQRIVDAANQRREQRLVYPALLLANRFYAVAPAWVIAALRPNVPPDLVRFLDTTSLDDCSFCNPAPTRPIDKLRWFRPGRERLAALRHMLLPDPNELGHWYPRLAHPALLPVAYAVYGTTVCGWGLRSLLGKPRLMLHKRHSKHAQG